MSTTVRLVAEVNLLRGRLKQKVEELAIDNEAEVRQEIFWMLKKFIRAHEDVTEPYRPHTRNRGKTPKPRVV